MKKTLLAVNLFLLLFTACKKDVPYLSPENSLLSFKITTANNNELVTNDINFVIGDTALVGSSGSFNNRSSLIATFSTSGAAVSVNGIEQTSGVTTNDFTNPVTYIITAKDGTQKKYVVKLKAFTGLPILYLNTDAPVTNRDDYINGTLKIDGNLDFTDGVYDGKIQIKGRGNSTWYQEKKPYKIKLPSKARMLGMPADKEWALLANYNDKTLMRNDVAFELSERLGLAWTPRRRFVEVIMNGEFIGNYLLTETVKTGNDRLNISTMDIKKPNDVSAGYLMEADMRMDGAQWFRLQTGLVFVLKEPDPLSDVQLNYIHKQFQDIEDTINSLVDVRKQIDLDSWIKWVIVNEVMRNHDAKLYSSCFFYSNNGKIYMGPVWDFDLSSGSDVESLPEGWFINNSTWLTYMFDYHPYYKQRFKEIWNSMYGSISSINDYIGADNNKLQFSQKENYARWNMLTASSFTGQTVQGSYQGEVDNLSNFLRQRISWMNSQISMW